MHTHKETFLSRLHAFFHTPNGYVCLALLVWWVLNLVQASFTELLDDEAYYWSWLGPCSENGPGRLAWGYFDHPPMVAVLIWLSQWCGGELGVRFASVCVLPLALYLFWTIIRPATPTKSDAWRYIMICFAMPLLQIYGFFATPDAPLIGASILFLWCFLRFLEKRGWGWTVAMGVSMALLGYSKYHGALVVGFAFLANIKLLKDWRTYVAIAIALLLMMPHFAWQNAHDWDTIVFHLVSRHKGFKIGNPLAFLTNLLLIFNPFFIWHYCKYFRQRKTLGGDDNTRHTLLFITVGVATFFALSSLRGYSQAQWLLPMQFGLIWLLFLGWKREAATEGEMQPAEGEMRQSEKKNRCKYLRIIVIVSAVLFLLTRLVIIFNPFGMKGELWNNRAAYEELHALADGRPMQINGYVRPAKYYYYTGDEAYSGAIFKSRRSQWGYTFPDEFLYGKEIVTESDSLFRQHTIKLANGESFDYSIITHYQPTRKVEVECLSIPETLACPAVKKSVPGSADDSIWLSFSLFNPYDFPIFTTPSDTIVVGLHIEKKYPPAALAPIFDTLPPHDTIRLCVQLPRPVVSPGSYPVAAVIGHNGFRPPRFSEYHNVTIVAQKPNKGQKH